MPSIDYFKSAGRAGQLLLFNVIPYTLDPI